MANEQIQVNEGQNWVLPIDRAGTATLATGGKYVDRDIEISVPQGEYSIVPSGEIFSQTDPIINSTIASEEDNSITKAKTISTTAPTTGDYFVITPNVTVQNTGTATVKVSAITEVSKDGFIAEKDESSANGNDVTIAGISVRGVGENTASSLYLPIQTLTNDAITASTEHLTGEEGSDSQDNLTVNFTLPAGYYDEQSISKTFSDLLPAINDDATIADVLYGKQVYDENGNLLTGTMANYSASGPKVVQSDDGNTSIIGSSVGLSEVDSSGISITAQGTLAAQAKIENAGYYVPSESVSTFYKSEEAVRYITSIQLGEGKSLESISVAGEATVAEFINNGTITKMEGIGTIAELSGNQEITELKGTLVVGTVTDEDEEKNNSAGKIILGQTTIVEDGELVKSQQTIEGDTIRITPGWVEKTEEIGVKAGDYSIECEKTNPSIQYETSVRGVLTSQAETDFVVTVTGKVTEGSHQATATIGTAGYIPTGNKTTTSEAIGIEGADVEVPVYLVGATFSSGLSDEKYSDNTSVSQFYNFSATDGYTVAGVKKQVEVFNGAFSWN